MKPGGEGMGDDGLLDELTDIVGAEAAERLVEHYSGSNAYYPKRIVRKVKYKKIREEFKKVQAIGNLVSNTDMGKDTSGQ